MFDMLSAMFYTLGLVTKRHVSGFPLVGAVFDTWAWLALPRAVLASSSGGLGALWLGKVPDLFGLAAFHLLFHAPFWQWEYLRSGREPSESDRGPS